MKKILLWSFILTVFFLAGCGKYNDKDIIRDLTKQLDSTKGYYLEGEMEITNNDDVFNYDVSVSFEKKNFYRVNLKNKANNHEQIILKNNEGVYVLTPSLNKSFKFQSEWPYNNSQVYLIQSLIKDLKDDNNRTFEEKDNYYIFKTKVNYPNNRRLVKQIIYLDKKLNFKEVHVLDDHDNPQIKMKFSSVDMKATFDNNYFSLSENMKVGLEQEKVADVTALKEIIYPLYIPDKTYLSGKDKIAKTNGERFILTFEGDYPFMLIEETAHYETDGLIVPVYGDPELLVDTVGSISDSSINWISNGIEYYIVSSVLDKNELLTIAKSIGVLPVAK
ncbi:MAG: LolA family protein [Bacilli bacterium]|jgi:outer membrane lipoprotein-sorting protein|nr:outer membrane lipoprotein carrier protein LolA [Bacilli bacterium]